MSAPCGLWDLSSQLGIEPGPLAVKASSPNHWTSREFPDWCFLNYIELVHSFYFK